MVHETVLKNLTGRAREVMMAYLTYLDNAVAQGQTFTCLLARMDKVDEGGRSADALARGYCETGCGSCEQFIPMSRAEWEAFQCWIMWPLEKMEVVE